MFLEVWKIKSVEDGVNTLYLKLGWKMGMDYYVFGSVEDAKCGRWGDTIYLKRGWKMGIDFFVFGGVENQNCRRWGTLYI